ncbi:MAG: hypothetical protein AMJ78_10550 [Omnitrophica WOR_2 bacterium SM23_29]|nr:MAG: hypothetical protein AMJ78_10550 [Omnitrophica WOR_2 bacterium SM23_29]
MSSQTVKVAISMPKRSFKALEGIRHKLSVSRSALIDEAVRYWLESKKRQQLVDRYEKGYIEKPEDVHHIKGLQVIQFDALSKEEWK